MKKNLSIMVYAAIYGVSLTSCVEPLPPAPPPYFRPNPPNPPQPVDPYAQPSDDYSQQPQDNPEPEPEPAPTRPGEYPTARSTTNPGEVTSPYEPYNVINVEGYKSGQLVRDPHNKQIFRVP